MGKETIKSDRLKLGLSILWFVFTFSMVTWWWIFALKQLDNLAVELPLAKYESLRRMLLWEGSILLAFILVGGLSLLVLTNRERMRNLRLRLFFSNFSHDLKTSLSRLRLRAEVLIANDPNPALQKLMEEVQRLDLQLENSLWVARGEEQRLLLQKQSLSDLLSSLRLEWPEMEIHLQKNAEIEVDQQAMKSVLRNLMQNAWIHGQATRIDFGVEPKEPGKIILTVRDNGKGFSGSIQILGKEMLPAKERQGNGLGLYLTKSLLKKMNGTIEFQALNPGFQAKLEVPGRIGSAK